MKLKHHPSSGGVSLALSAEDQGWHDWESTKETITDVYDSIKKMSRKEGAVMTGLEV